MVGGWAGVAVHRACELACKGTPGTNPGQAPSRSPRTAPYARPGTFVRRKGLRPSAERPNEPSAARRNENKAQFRLSHTKPGGRRPVLRLAGDTVRTASSTPREVCPEHRCPKGNRAAARKTRTQRSWRRQNAYQACNLDTRPAPVSAAAVCAGLRTRSKPPRIRAGSLVGSSSLSAHRLLTLQKPIRLR